MRFKPKMPPGILGGILKYGFNLTAILHILLIEFVRGDAKRVQANRTKRLAREAKLKEETEREPHVENETN